MNSDAMTIRQRATESETSNFTIFRNDEEYTRFRGTEHQMNEMLGVLKTLFPRARWTAVTVAA